MTPDMYLRILKDRLEERAIDRDTVEKTIARERSMISGLRSEEVGVLFSEERLSVIIASAEKRSQRACSELHANSLESIDEQSTIAAHNSLTTITGTAILNASDAADTPIETEEVTVVSPKSSGVPKALLENDTATVVISGPSEGETVIVDGGMETVLVPPTLNSGLEKLLSDSSTVRISEKDTALFLTDEQAFATVALPSTADVGAMKPVVTPSTPEDVNLLPLIDEAHRQKKERGYQIDDYSDTSESLVSVSEADLKNPRFKLLFCLLSLIVFPLACVGTVCWGAVFLLGAAALLLLTVLPIIVYTCIISGSLGSALFGIYFSWSFGLGSDFERCLIGIGLTVIALLIFVLSLLFLHRLVIPLYYFFNQKLRSFIQKNASFFRLICRAMFRTVRYI